MSPTFTLTPSFKGDRFDGARLPVVFGEDLIAIKDLILALAKEAWLAERPERARIPRNSLPSIDFLITAIEDGSAMPVLKCEVEEPADGDGFLGVSSDTYVEAGYNLLLEIMADTSKLPEFRQASNENIVKRSLSQLGKRLNDGEVLNFPKAQERLTEGVEPAAKWTRETREQFSLRFKGKVEKEFEIARAQLKGARALGDGMTEYELEFEAQGLGTFKSKVPYLEYSKYYNVLNRNYALSCAATFKADDKIDGLVEIKASDKLAHEFSERIEMYSSLEIGWNEGHGGPIDQDVIGRTLDYLENANPILNFYVVAPTIEGGIHLEFAKGNWDYSLIFLPKGRVEAFGLSIDGNLEDEVEIETATPQEINQAVVSLLARSGDMI